jgi:hypothetical protein
MLPACPDVVKPISFRSRMSRIDVAAACAFVFLAWLIALRLDKGTGFGDEGYYALFVDEWLKGGFDSRAT